MLDYIFAYLKFGEGEEGQTMAEYAVVLAVITVIVITALTFLSTGISSALGRVTAKLTSSGT